MGLTPTHRLAMKLLGARAARSPSLERLADQLQQAHMPIRAEAYLAYAWFTGGLASISIFAMALLLFTFTVILFDVPFVYGLFLLLLPGFVYYMITTVTLAAPMTRARGRGKQIDQKLPYATNYIAAMASAGVIPAEIFKSLARQEVYGEVAKEAGRIYKDLELHGMDIVTGLRRAMDRSPSQNFQALLQGAITTITSGGDLTAYFHQKTVSLQFENRQVQHQFIETMGVMAEAYVTAAVAGPLFLMVMLAIFVLVGSGEMILLQATVYLLLPVASAGFVFGLKSMIPES